MNIEQLKKLKKTTLNIYKTNNEELTKALHHYHLMDLKHYDFEDVILNEIKDKIYKKYYKDFTLNIDNFKTIISILFNNKHVNCEMVYEYNNLYILEGEQIVYDFNTYTNSKFLNWLVSSYNGDDFRSNINSNEMITSRDEYIKTVISYLDIKKSEIELTEKMKKHNIMLINTNDKMYEDTKRINVMLNIN